MLTANDAWTEALERVDRTPVYLVTITTAVGTTVRFVTADENLFDATMGLAAIESQNPTELDPITLNVTIGAWELVFVDDTGGGGSKIRTLDATVVLKGKRVRIQFGEKTLAEGDYLDVGDNFVIDEVLPGPGLIKVTVLDEYGFTIEGTIPKFRWPGPPLRVARDIIQGVSAGDAIDAAEFDSKLYTDVSHLMVCRAFFSDRMRGLFGWLKPDEDLSSVPAFDAIRDLLGLVGCFLVPGEGGKFRVKYFDRTAAAVHTFSPQDVADFAELGNHIDILNDVKIVGRTYDGQEFTRYSGEDSTSKTAHGYPDSSGIIPRTYERLIPERGPHPWLQSCVRVANNQPAPLDASATTLRLFFPKYFGFAGTQVEDASGNEIEPPTVAAQQTEHTITADRPGYILLVKPADPSGTPVLTEIVKATAFAYHIENTPAVYFADYISIDTPIGSKNFWALGDFTIARAQFGTFARDWTHDLFAGNVFAYDITADVLMVQRLLDRASYGIPRIGFTVPGRFHTLQLGDELALEDPIYVTYGAERLTASTVWQLIGKAPAWFENTPGYRLTCARIRTGAVAPLVPVTTDPPDDIPTSTATEYYYDASGAIYLDADLRPYYGPPGPLT